MKGPNMLRTFSRDVRTEALKAVTLRSIRFVLAATIFAPAALAAASAARFDPTYADAFPTASHGFETAGFAQPLIILLAALVAGSEFSGGQIRLTLLANPHRVRVLAAKFAVIAATAAILGVVAIGIAVLSKRAILDRRGVVPFEFSTGMAWNLLGVGINFALIALIAASVTVLSRTIIVALIILVPLVLGLTLSLVIMFPALKFLPDLAGIQLLMPYPSELELLDEVPGGLVMAGWTVAVGGLSWVVFRLRDVGG